MYTPAIRQEQKGGKSIKLQISVMSYVATRSSQVNNNTKVHFSIRFTKGGGERNRTYANRVKVDCSTIKLHPYYYFKNNPTSHMGTIFNSVKSTQPTTINRSVGIG